MSNELLPCPFCGGEARTVRDVKWWVACPNCSCEIGFEGMDYGVCYGHYDTEAEAIKAWNTRADDRSQAAAYWQRAYEETVRERTCKREEIVRCRDCASYVPAWNCCTELNGESLVCVAPNGFCAWGKRKEASE